MSDITPLCFMDKHTECTEVSCRCACHDFGFTQDVQPHLDSGLNYAEKGASLGKANAFRRRAKKKR